MTAMTETPPAQDNRTFLVVLDETDEWRAALRFACRRALHTGGDVAVLHVIEPLGVDMWLATAQVANEELRADAEARLDEVAKTARSVTGRLPIRHLREGSVAEQLLALIEEEPSISVLVLASSPNPGRPGPLIQTLLYGRQENLRVPLTIVPGHLTDAQIDAVS